MPWQQPFRLSARLCDCLSLDGSCRAASSSDMLFAPFVGPGHASMQAMLANSLPQLTARCRAAQLAAAGRGKRERRRVNYALQSPGTAASSGPSASSPPSSPSSGGSGRGTSAGKSATTPTVRRRLGLRCLKRNDVCNRLRPDAVMILRAESGTVVPESLVGDVSVVCLTVQDRVLH